MIRLLLALLACGAAAAPSPEREKPLRDAAWAGRWIEASRRYDELEKSGAEPSAQASYLAGLALWRLRRPEDARAPLQRAADAGFKAGGGRPQPAELLKKIDAYDELKPPLVAGTGGDPLEVYADARTPLTAPLLDAVPRFAEIGAEIFGAPPVPVRLFVFADEAKCERFFALFAEAGGPAHSTGGLGQALVCAPKAKRRTVDESISMALHETMHAWTATYLQKKFDRPVKVPPYADEGLATYAAGLWSPEIAALPAARVTAWRAQDASPPPLDSLRRRESFYAPANALMNYMLSERLIERLIGPPSDGAAKIPAFLDALARSDDDRAAWREVSGKDADAEYAGL